MHAFASETASVQVYTSNVGPKNSVRVEVERMDEPETHATRSPVETSNGNRWLVAAVVVPVLVALTIGLGALRPPTGQAADGLARQAPTTTVPASTTTTTEPPSEVTLAVHDTNAAAVGFVPQPDGIVWAGNGFFGLGQLLGGEALPLFWSIDGIDWVSVDATVDRLEPQVGNWRYSHLITSEIGFGVTTETRYALVRSAIVEREETDPETVIEQIVSSDGQTWTVDEQFRSSAAGETSVTFHFEDAIGADTVPKEVSIPLDGLFAQALVANSDVDTDGICSLEPLVTSQSPSGGFRTISCASSVQVGTGVVNPDQIVDLGSVDDLLSCADVLARIAARQRTSTTIYRSTGADHERIGLLSGTSYTELSDGTLVGLVEGDSTLSDFASCEDFPGASGKSTPTGLEWLSPQGEVRSLPLPQTAARDEERDSLPPSLRAIEEGVLAVTGRTIWRVNLNPGDTSGYLVVELPVDEFALTDFVFVNEGLGVGVGGGAMVFVDLDEEEITTVDIAIGEAPEVLYADSRRVIVRLADSPSSLRVIDLR